MNRIVNFFMALFFEDYILKLFKVKFQKSINNKLLKMKNNHLYHFFKKNVVKRKYNKKESCQYFELVEINKNIKVKDYQVIMVIIYRLKMGSQWRHLPIEVKWE